MSKDYHKLATKFIRYQDMFSFFKYLGFLTTQSGQSMNVTDNCTALLSLNLIDMALRMFNHHKTIRYYNHEGA